jgi:hypothetical protein
MKNKYRRIGLGTSFSEPYTRTGAQMFHAIAVNTER